MSESAVPGVMPIDREEWFRQLNLSNFVNSYYEYRDLQQIGGCRSVLIIGPGQGLGTAVLRWRGFDVTTIDVDSTFHPDIVGSVHDMTCFADQQFDAVIASHVLEHLPVQYLPASVAEISRVGRSALIYLPVAGRHGLIRFVAGVRNIDVSIIWDVFNWLRRPDGTTPAFCEGQHYWEIGWRGYRLADIRRMLEERFTILADYRNRDWLPSHNFVLRSKYVRGGATG